jgi:hypothetical protein
MTQDDDASETGFTVSYTVIGCARQDMLLLKSVFSLHGKGRIVWNFQPSQDVAPNVDFVIAGDEMEPSAVLALSHSIISGGQLVLWVGRIPPLLEAHQIFHCDHPLRALQLVEQLRQIEPLLRNKKPHVVAQQAYIPDESLEKLQLALVCWPSPKFLSRNKDFSRLAAMLSVRGMTLAELVARSGKSREICREFFYDLSREGYAKALKQEADAARPDVVHNPPPSHAPASVGDGLRGVLRKIRIRLGLASA